MKRVTTAAMESLTGLEARKLIRSGKMKGMPTSGWCRGTKQANIAIIQSDVGKDFAEFATYNSGCLPLLYQSKPGETGCPLASGESDIRTDLPAYKIYKNGEFVEKEDNVTDYDWKDMVSFYIGCSFSFEDMMIKNSIPVRNVEQNTTVSMYKTKIQCHTVGPFACNMVVSMRPIPENQLSLVCDITRQMADVHGGPVHIGNPDVIVKNEFEDPDFGDKTELCGGDVPVFWACGVTCSEAIKAAKKPLAITHSPGMMYLTDVPQKEYSPSTSNSEKCEVIKYSEKGQRFSVLSRATQRELQTLEDATVDDPGNRGISHLVVPGDFAKAAVALSHASSVALITGMPCRKDEVPDETDGLPGVYSLAAMLQALGKKVTILVDKSGFEMNKRLMKKQVAAGTLCEAVPIIPFCNDSGPCHSLADENGQPRYDVILATERSGRAEDGNYYNMRGIAMCNIDPIDDMFEEASKNRNVITIGIGDGGNELGMGKVKQSVKKNIPNGQKIACDAAADLLIAAGVSNWGCYALSFALYALRRCTIHDRYYRRATGLQTDVEKLCRWALPTVEREEESLRQVESEGIKDGVRPDQAMSVDGFKFHPTHADKIKQMWSALHA